MSETPRQRYLRNHQENIRTMRACLVRAERDGDTEKAEAIRAIVEAWEGIGKQADQAKD